MKSPVSFWFLLWVIFALITDVANASGDLSEKLLLRKAGQNLNNPQARDEDSKKLMLQNEPANSETKVNRGLGRVPVESEVGGRGHRSLYEIDPNSEWVKQEKIVPNFTDPWLCNKGTCIAPDGKMDESSQYVAISHGKELFGSCTDGETKYCCYDNDGNTNVCDFASAWVKKDGSCFGKTACKDAHLPLIIDGCKGDYACTHLGDENGYGGAVIHSCHDTTSCMRVAYSSGRTEDVVDSCHGVHSCFGVAHGGKAKSIQNSCIGDYSCSNLASAGGEVGDVKHSCCGKKVCTKKCLGGDPCGDLIMQFGVCPSKENRS